MTTQEKIKNLCEEWFVNYWYQEYAGARQECVYCGCAIEGKHHSAQCPCTKWQEIKEELEVIADSLPGDV